MTEAPSLFARGRGPLRAVLVAAAAYAVWFFVSWSYLEDDAFIHLEFAKNLRDGLGFAFDGKHVFADSSPLWVALTAALSRAFGLDLYLAIKLLAALGCGAFVLACARLARIQVARWSGWHELALLATLLHPFALGWSFSGMETLGAVSVVAYALQQIAACESASWAARLLRAACALAAGALLRFELVLLAGIVLGAFALMHAGPRDRRFLARMAGAALLVWLPVCAFLVYARLDLGSFVPTTNAAKRILAQSLPGAQWATALRTVQVWLVAFGAYLIGAVLLRIAARAPRTPLRPVAWVAWLWIAVLCAFYVLDRAAVQTRYILLLLPAVQVLFGETLIACAERTRRAAALALAPLFIAGTYMFLVSVLHRNQVGIECVRNTKILTRYIRETVDPSWPIAVISLGQLAYEVPQPVIDLGGLVHPGAVAYFTDHEGLVRWARQAGAKCFIVGEDIPGTVVRKEIPTHSVGWVFSPTQWHNESLIRLHCDPR